jgi:surfactin family lipopeptide synthetase A
VVKSPPVRVSEADRKRLELLLRENQLRVPLVPGIAITRRSSSDLAPLSLPQEEIFHRAEENADKPPFYNECITVYRKGSLDIRVLERSLAEIIRRHEIWRTTYDTVNGRPVQVIHTPPDDFSVPILDFRGLPEAQQELRVLHSVEELTQRPFDLSRGPLLRFLLVTTGERAHRLFLIAHQSIVDGVSVYQVFPTELAVLYEAFSQGNPSPLPELNIQFADYADWEQRALDTKKIDEHVGYWRQRLGGELQPLRWPAERARMKTQSYRGIVRPFAITKELTATLKFIARREGVTLFMLLLSGFVVLLHRYTTQEDIVVGTLSAAARQRTELQRLLGYFLNPVVLRFDLSSNPTLRELLQMAREVVSEAISHDVLPLELLAQSLKAANETSGNPFFNVAISLQPPIPESIRPGWNVTSMDVGNGGAVWDLYMAFIDRPDGMIGRAQYNPDVFQVSAISRMLQDLETVLETLTLQPQLHLSDLPKLTEKEGGTADQFS